MVPPARHKKGCGSSASLESQTRFHKKNQPPPAGTIRPTRSSDPKVPWPIPTFLCISNQAESWPFLPSQDHQTILLEYRVSNPEGSSLAHCSNEELPPPDNWRFCPELHSTALLLRRNAYRL